MSTKILIFGTGAIGTVYAYLLNKTIPQSDIVCICRSNHKAASEHGFTINSNVFGDGLRFHPTIVQSIVEAELHGPYRYIVVATKVLPTTPSFAEQLKPVIGPESTIVLMQNGIAIEEQYHDVFPSNALLSCVAYLPVTQISPAVVVHKEVEKLQLGTFPFSAPAEHKAAAKDFAALLQRGGATVEVHDDIQRQRWTKLLVNASWNPICALSRSSDAYFMQASPGAIEYVRDVMTEISWIAEAVGYGKGVQELLDWQMGRAKARKVPGIEPSMLADVFGGRPLEIDAIVGNALKIAQKNDVKVPLLRAIYLQAKALDESITRSRNS